MIQLGNIARGDDFFDRNGIREEIWRYLQGHHLVLRGARRLGKSSVLERLVEEANAHQFTAQRLDVSGYQGAEEFIEALERTLLPTGIPQILAGLSKGVDRVNQISASWPSLPSVGIRLKDRPHNAWSKKAQALEKRLTPMPILILLDEFSVFLENLIQHDQQEAKKFLAWLRTWRTKVNITCRFIFTGSIGINYLLETHQLTTYFNDCHELELGPFSENSAKEMVETISEREGGSISPETIQILCNRVGWLSPYFTSLLLDSSINAARARIEEDGITPWVIKTGDVITGYEQLLESRSHFTHWEGRLKRGTREPLLSYCQKILTFIAKSSAGLNFNQLSQRLSSYESDPEKRKGLIYEAHRKLMDEGYLSSPDERTKIHFLSSLLKEYWRRNHA